MNSTLQCLVQCPILTDFFLDGSYLTQLNRTSPLGIRSEYPIIILHLILWPGRQGKVAETYAQMVKDYWYCFAECLALAGFC